MPTEKRMYTKRGIISVQIYEGSQGGILEFLAVQAKWTFIEY